MNWLERNTPSRLRFVSECHGFVIAADNPTDGHMPWWQAKTVAMKDLASGYGDAGLAHCKRHCEIAAAKPVEQLQAEVPAAECTRVEIHAPSSNTEPSEVPTTSAQSALF
jgi:hypothetical protein